MKMPELQEQYAWTVYEWEGEKYVGVKPAEGFKWRFDNGLPENVSAYSARLKEKTKAGIIETAKKLENLLFNSFLVLPPLVVSNDYVEINTDEAMEMEINDNA